jgi:HK97 family phage major capsid protein
MRTLRQINDELAKLSKDNAPLAAKFIEGGLEGDDLTQFRTNTAQLEKLYGERADAERAEADHKRDLDAAQRSIETSKHYHEGTGRRAGGQAAESRQDAGEWGRSVGERFAHSEELAEYRQNVRPGASSRRFDVGSFYAGHADEVERRFGPGPDEQRALITSTTLTTVIQPQRLPGIYAPELRELRVRDVLANGRTSSNMVEFVREASRTNNAAEVAEATSLTDGAKPESGFTLEEASAPVRTIATLMYITRAALDDADQMQSYIDQLLRRFIEEREDQQILTGNGTAPNLRGLINQSGIQNLNGAYFTTTMPNKLDRLRRAKTRVRLGGRGRATAMILHPENVEEFELMKTNSSDTDNNQYAALGGGPFGAAAGGRIWGLPYVESENLTVNKAVVLDGTAAMVMDRMDAQTYVTDSNRDLFERNIITILVESRIALPVFFPGKIAYVDLAATS